MPLRNGEHGYGLVTKLLHWVTFGTVVAQFVVGYNLEDDDHGRGRGRGRGRGGDDDESLGTGETSVVPVSDGDNSGPGGGDDDGGGGDNSGPGGGGDDGSGDDGGDGGGGDGGDGGDDDGFEDYGDAVESVFSGDVFSGGVSLTEWHVLLGLAIIVLAVVRLAWRATTPLPPWSEAYSDGERALQGWLEKLMLLLLFVVPTTGLLLAFGTAGLPLHIAAHIAFYVVVGAHIALQLFHTVVRRDRHLQRML